MIKYKVQQYNPKFYSLKTVFTGDLQDCLEGLAEELNPEAPESVTVLQAIEAGYSIQRA